jgi:hypothetical protein
VRAPLEFEGQVLLDPAERPSFLHTPLRKTTSRPSKHTHTHIFTHAHGSQQVKVSEAERGRVHPHHEVQTLLYALLRRRPTRAFEVCVCVCVCVHFLEGD